MTTLENAIAQVREMIWLRKAKRRIPKCAVPVAGDIVKKTNWLVPQPKGEGNGSTH